MIEIDKMTILIMALLAFKIVTTQLPGTSSVQHIFRNLYVIIGDKKTGYSITRFSIPCGRGMSVHTLLFPFTPFAQTKRQHIIEYFAEGKTGNF